MRTTLDATVFDAPLPAFGPAMRFVLAIATLRARERAPWTGPTRIQGKGDPAALLWDLAERYHPEETWLAESYLRGERSLDELSRHAPRGGLAPSLQTAARPLLSDRYDSILSNQGNATASA